MNASRSIILRTVQVMPSAGRRSSLYMATQTIDAFEADTSTSNSVASVMMDEQPSTQLAKNIQQLLKNIGVRHRVSLAAIESMIQKMNEDGNSSNGFDTSSVNPAITDNEIIDLIAQIRSM